MKLFAEFLTELEAKKRCRQGVVAWTGLLAKVPTREARILSRDHASGPRAAIV